MIDYGAPAADLYGPRRRAGTLMTYRGHVAEGDSGAPYRDVGERDITAHVDTTALGAALVGAGLDLLGETSQAELLVGCGLEELVQRRQAGLARASEALELRSAVMRLLDPRHLGGFRAVLAGRGIAAEPPLRGLSVPDAGEAAPVARAQPGAGPGAGKDRPRRPTAPRGARWRRPSPATMPWHVRARRPRACARLTRASRRAGGPATDPVVQPRNPWSAGRREVRWKASGTSSASRSRASRSSSW